MRRGPWGRRLEGVSRLVAAVVLSASVSAAALAAAPHRADALPSGRPPAPGKFGTIRFTGAFADGHIGGVITLEVTGDGRRVTGVTAFAPGPCDDRDFGRQTPGKDGAPGVVFWFFPKGGTAISPNGSFSISGTARGRPGAQIRVPPRVTATITVTGVFTGDEVRGRVNGRSKLPYATCTANVAFRARRDFG